MNLRTTAVRTLAAAALAAGAVTATAGAAHAAQAFPHVTIHASGACDTTTGEWVVDWSISNAAQATATLTDVVSAPASSPATGVPATVAAGSTEHATQRIPGTGGQTASLSLTATWPDGATYAASWQFRPPAPCTPAAIAGPAAGPADPADPAATTATATAGPAGPAAGHATAAVAEATAETNSAAATDEPPVETGPWPIVDESGRQRSTLSFNPETGYAMACYSGEPENVVIEVEYESGQTARRLVPQFGCNVAGPYGGTGPVVKVRGLVGEFANPWHRVR